MVETLEQIIRLQVLVLLCVYIYMNLLTIESIYRV